MNKYVIGCLILFIAIAVSFVSLRVHNDKNYIEKVIHKKGGEIVYIDRKLVGNGPFWYKEKHQEIYKIEYTLNGEKKIAWVRIGTFNKKWIWK